MNKVATLARPAFSAAPTTYGGTENDIPGVRDHFESLVAAQRNVLLASSEDVHGETLTL